MYSYECTVVNNTIFSLIQPLNSHKNFHKYDYDVRVKFLYIIIIS